MKKNLFYLFALVCAMSLFASCGSDDDNETNVSGTYSGNLEVTIDDNGLAPSPQNIELTSPAKGKVNFVLKNFILASDQTGAGAGSTPVGTIKINDIDLVESNGKFTFTKTVEKLKIEAGDKEGISQDKWLGPLISQSGIPVTLNGTITGNDIKLDISIPFGDMNIAVQFAGTK